MRLQRLIIGGAMAVVVAARQQHGDGGARHQQRRRRRQRQPLHDPIQPARLWTVNRSERELVLPRMSVAVTTRS